MNCHHTCCAVAKGDVGVTSPGAGLGIWFGELVNVAAHVTGPPSRHLHGPGEKLADTPGTRVMQELPESQSAVSPANCLRDSISQFGLRVYPQSLFNEWVNERQW